LAWRAAATHTYARPLPHQQQQTPILAHLLDVRKSLRALVVLATPPTPPTEEMAFLAENDVR
jgi:hypothetical protein